MTDFEALRACGLFSGLEKETLETSIAPLGKPRSIGRGSSLLIPQQRLDFFAVICSGKIQALHLFPDGSSCIVDTLGPGNVMGLELLFTHSRVAPYHVLAATAAKLLFFPVEMVLRQGILRDEVRLSILEKALSLISQINMRREYRLAILAQRGLRARILTYLTMQAGRRGTDCFAIPFSREELADFLCVNRSTLSHELSLMQSEGLIEFRKNHFTLLCREEGKSQ